MGDSDNASDISLRGSNSDQQLHYSQLANPMVNRTHSFIADMDTARQAMGTITPKHT